LVEGAAWIGVRLSLNAHTGQTLSMYAARLRARTSEGLGDVA